MYDSLSFLGKSTRCLRQTSVFVCIHPAEDSPRGRSRVSGYSFRPVLPRTRSVSLTVHVSTSPYFDVRQRSYNM